MRMAWVDSANDPDTQNNRILLSGGTWSQNADPKLDELINAIKTEMDPGKRKALILKQQDYMRETFPVAYLIQMGTLCCVAAKLDLRTPRANDTHKFSRRPTKYHDWTTLSETRQAPNSLPRPPDPRITSVPACPSSALRL